MAIDVNRIATIRESTKSKPNLIFSYISLTIAVENYHEFSLNRT